MSSIGFTNLGAITLAGSAAGAQGNAADTDEIKQAGADKKSAADRNAQAARALGDVAETDLSSDRDADGRQPFVPGSRHGKKDAGNEETGKSHRPVDVSGERGNALDLEA